MECTAKLYSNALFFVERWSFSLQDPIFLADFQRLVRVRSASMTNTKPLGRVMCQYCYNRGHVRQNCKKL